MPEITGPLQWAMFQEQQRSQKSAKENEELLSLLSGLSKWKTEQDRWKSGQDFERQKWADEAASRQADVEYKKSLGDYYKTGDKGTTNWDKQWATALQLSGGDQMKAWKMLNPDKASTDISIAPEMATAIESMFKMKPGSFAAMTSNAQLPFLNQYLSRSAPVKEAVRSPQVWSEQVKYAIENNVYPDSDDPEGRTTQKSAFLGILKAQEDPFMKAVKELIGNQGSGRVPSKTPKTPPPVKDNSIELEVSADGKRGRDVKTGAVYAIVDGFVTVNGRRYRIT